MIAHRPLALAGLALALTLSACGSAPEAPSSAPAGAPAATPLTVVHQATASPIVELRFVFRAGSAYDPPGQEGAAWLLGHLMAQGGTEALTYPALLATLHPWAASIDVQVDRELLTFVARVHRDHVDRFYPIVRDVLLRPRLAADDFRRLKTQALTRLTQQVRTSDDEALAKLVLEATLFEGTPYAHPALGTEAGLGALTLDALKAHRRRALARDRLTVGLGGAADAALVERVRADLAALPAVADLPATVPPPPPDAQRLIVVEQPNAGATAMALGHTLPVTRADPDYPALALAASYFGQHRQFHGVLFQQVREKRGLNYGTYAYAEAFRQEGWERLALTNIPRRHQFWSLWVRPVPHEDRHFTLRLVTWLFRALHAQGVPAADVAAVRDFLTGYVWLERQTDQRRLGDAIDDRFYGLNQPAAERLTRALATLDAPAVAEVIARRLRPDALTVVVVTKDAQAFADAVLADAPSPKAYASPKPAEVTDLDAKVAPLPLGFRPEQVRVVPAAELFAK